MAAGQAGVVVAQSKLTQSYDVSSSRFSTQANLVTQETDINNDNSSSQATARIIFTPTGKRGEFPIGTPVLQAARSLGVDLDSVCGGRGICGRCQVLCSEGEFSKHKVVSSSDHLTPFGPNEERYEKIKGEMKAGRRLGCQAKLQGDVVIDVPEDSQVHRQVIRKAADHVNITLDPSVRLYYVEVQQPDMHDPSGDLKRLKKALHKEWQLENLTCEKSLFSSLQTILRDGEWKVTVAVYDPSSKEATAVQGATQATPSKRILSVWPGFHDRAYGVAIDVGSTTIAAHLCNLVDGEVLASSGAMNPQIRFGEDLMSRVSYVMMNPGGDAEMTEAVIESINQLLVAVCEEAAANVDGHEDASINDILDITFVANPVMHHLLLGINPVELGWAPFALAFDEAASLAARDMGIHANPNARTYILPCIAGHVGADAAGVVLAEKPYTLEPATLLVDVGTNAEIVLGNKDRLLACSSPTGPAFEGAQISSGQRAAPGAIERVRIDRETLEPRFSVIGSDVWSDAPDFAEANKSLGVSGICGSGIIEVIAEMFLTGIINQDGVIQGELQSKSDRILEEGRTFSYLLHDGDVRIVITQNDVREIQLAKAALYAGVRLLMDKLEISSVERIRLAGAFGSHIDVKYAMVIGLIPDCDLQHVSSAGNAAGNGARIALMNVAARQEIETVVQSVEKIETAVEARFQEHFVDAMAFPNKSADFTELCKVVQMPERQASSSSDEGQSGRRARRRRRRT